MSVSHARALEILAILIFLGPPCLAGLSFIAYTVYSVYRARAAILNVMLVFGLVVLTAYVLGLIFA